MSLSVVDQPPASGIESIDALPRPHQLWWEAGSYGKGILYRSGRVHTWPEDEGSHLALSQHYTRRPGM